MNRKCFEDKEMRSFKSVNLIRIVYNDNKIISISFRFDFIKELICNERNTTE